MRPLDATHLAERREGPGGAGRFGVTSARKVLAPRQLGGGDRPRQPGADDVGVP